MYHKHVAIAVPKKWSTDASVDLSGNSSFEWPARPVPDESVPAYEELSKEVCGESTMQLPFAFVVF